MSNQSGIRASQELLDTFNAAALEKTTRAIRVSITNETLVPSGTAPVADDWQKDFGLIVQYFEPKTPCYVLYRLDALNATEDYEWLFFCYVPDNAPVREKMLYASTRATLVKDLGDYRFKDSVYGSTTAEFTAEGYAKHCKHQDSAAPLTEREKEIESLRKTEHGSDIGTETRQSHVSGAEFPIHEDAIASFQKIRDGDVNAVVLVMDSTSGETLVLETAKAVSQTAEFVSLFPEDLPRFGLFRLPSSNNAEAAERVVFVYSCPLKSKVRERMLYSSCRRATIKAIEDALGYEVKNKLEVDDPKELTDEYLRERIPHLNAESNTGAAPETQPPVVRAFSKPAPPGRGPSRMHKPQAGGSS